ncbi:MAG: phosphate ABC transporter substrate-binding protein [Pseudomonadota bacterium]
MKSKFLRMAGVGLIFGLIAVCVTLNSCSRSSSKTITLAGSTAFQPFAEKLAERYLIINKGVQINVQGGGSAVGIQSALSQTADIGMADMLKLPDEAKELAQTIVAKDGIAIVVNPANSVNSVSSQQAKDIFSGKVSNWKDLGGKDVPIRVISREEGSGTKKSFDKLVLGDEKLTSNALFQNSNGTCREAVANDSSAIGYVSIGLVNGKVKALAYNGVKPVNADVKNNTYPLARPIFFLTKGEPKEYVKHFIDYVLSNEGQELLEKEGLIAAR